MPMINVGIATIIAEIRRRSKARCSRACIIFARSSSDKGWAILTWKGGDLAAAIAEII